MRSRGVLVFVLAAFVACGSDDSASNGPTGDGGNDGSVGDGGPGDGGGGGDGSNGDGARGDAGPPPCGTSTWATYGHDAQRTSATDACIAGALTFKWRYVPTPPPGKKINAVFNAIAQSDGVFLQWESQNDPYLGTTAADRVGVDGTHTWTFNSGTDSNLANWLNIGLGSIVVNDDGLYYLDPATGMKTHSTGVDNWGQVAPDPARLYVVNTSHVDGPKIFVGAYDGMAKQLWAKDEYGTCRIDAADATGGLAADGGDVFYAPSYAPGTGVMLGFASGVYAFDGATGTQKWFQPTTPAGAISAGSGRVYVVEAGGKLVARNQTDGVVGWTASVAGIGAQAPVLAGSNAIVAGSAAVTAFDAATGTVKWSVPIAGAATIADSIAFSGGCAGSSVTQARGTDTTIAAALGSSSLVVTAPDGVHVLKLADGMELWKGTIAQAMGTLKNPVLVGKRVYAIDSGALVALEGT